MPSVKLTLIPEPDQGTAVFRGRITPFMRGEGDTDYLCGECGEILVESAVAGGMTGIFRCPRCGKYNAL